MKKLKTFEAFGMQRDNCDRCGKSTSYGATTMSVFNEDVICMDCKKEEKNDPEYGAAVEAEIEALRKGNTNYKGAIPNYKPLRRN
jgi:hypothetical protein